VGVGLGVGEGVCASVVIVNEIKIIKKNIEDAIFTRVFDDFIGFSD